MSQPPSVGPMVGASVAVRPISTEICARRAPGNSRNEVANTVGIIAPPMKPCSARNVTIAPRLSEKAQAAEKMVKPSALMVNSTRVDSSRDSQPDSGIITISAIR